MADTPTVLFGDDGSASSDVAFGWIDHQSWPGWRLRVLHAEMPPFGRPLPDSEVTPHTWQPPAPRAVSPRASFAEVEHLLAHADPRIALMDPADLLVVGPRGRGVFKALNLGSVSEWLLTHPPSPMVIARGTTEVRHVVVAHDTSQSADLAVRAFAALPWAGAASCTVVVVDDGRVDADAAVGAARDALAGAGIEPEVVVRQGPATAAVEGELDRRRPDLVVLGTRGLTGMRRFHVGSTAGAVARAAPCSVLVACAASGDAG